MQVNVLFDQANGEWDAGHVRRAFQLMSQAAAAGHVLAQNSLGYFFDHGIGVKKNRTKALYWYRRAAAKGDDLACGNLAISYRDAGKNKEEKFWFKKALARGDTDAAVDLAKLYLIGGTKVPQRDLTTARKYLVLAARSRHTFPDRKQEARRLLKRLASRPSPRRPTAKKSKKSSSRSQRKVR
jgi:TPR repeat protein